MATVVVSRTVGIVFEEADTYRRTFFTQALLCPPKPFLKNPLTRLVVGHELHNVIALRRRILRMIPAI